MISFFQVWEDQVLRWDPEKFGGVTHIRLPATALWTPDIVLYNKWVLLHAPPLLPLLTHLLLLPLLPLHSEKYQIALGRYIYLNLSDIATFKNIKLLQSESIDSRQYFLMQQLDKSEIDIYLFNVMLHFFECVPSGLSDPSAPNLSPPSSTQLFCSLPCDPRIQKLSLLHWISNWSKLLVPTPLKG